MGPQYGSSLDIELSEKGTGFFLSIDFDFTLNDYQEIVPSIIRNEEDAFLGILHHAIKVVYTFHCHPEGSEVRTTRDLIARSIKISPSSR